MGRTIDADGIEVLSGLEEIVPKPRGAERDTVAPGREGGSNGRFQVAC
jgi:hypothetical protein